MRLQKSPLHVSDHAYRAALELSTSEEDDREFRDFIESISVPRDELAAIINTSEVSSVSVKPCILDLELNADSAPVTLGRREWNSTSAIRTRLMARVRQLATLAMLSLGLAGLRASRRKQ